MEKELIITSDGSHSIYLPEMNEHYHSKHGAILESEHIFIQSGLLEVAKKKKVIEIFEVGMGTGLNVLTTLNAAALHHLKINYNAIEAFPPDWSLLAQLNYAEQLKLGADIFELIHTSEWEKEIKLSSQFSLLKHNEKMSAFNIQPNSYDLIYFDAFAPEKQNEMWTEEIFEALFHSLKTEGVLVTYCVKGEIKRRLKAIGFQIEKLAGPKGGKREMLRARKG